MSESDQDVGRRVVVVGGGETARLAFEYFTHDSPHEVVAFAVDGSFREGDSLLGLPYVDLETLAEAYPPGRHSAFVAVSSGKLNRTRRRLFNSVKRMGFGCVSYISSHAFVWHNVEIGENCFVFENNVLQHMVRIGDNVTLWGGNHIGHNSIIGDDVFVSAHVVVSGFCEIGARSFLGVNSSLTDGCRVAPDTVVGMGATVTKNVDEPGRVIVGTPGVATGDAFRSFDVPEDLR